MAADAFDGVEKAERVADVTDQLLGLDGREPGGPAPLRGLHDSVGHPLRDRQSLRFSVFDGHAFQRTESRRQLGVSFLKKPCECRDRRPGEVIEHRLEEFGPGRYRKSGPNRDRCVTSGPRPPLDLT
ncbi:hypothetical protein GCM10009743_11750 [Kribbella swartbergensis]